MDNRNQSVHIETPPFLCDNHRSIPHRGSNLGHIAEGLDTGLAGSLFVLVTLRQSYVYISYYKCHLLSEAVAVHNGKCFIRFSNHIVKTWTGGPQGFYACILPSPGNK